ncbi:MAG: endopeptidase La [Candidatus Manganitrophus sp.]|nr:MAG: endopeptidase La [Candidatus Manganitrophus sp.]
MGREFVRVSLGGIRDEAEIRGHRRTYVGSLPGRIIQGIKQAGTNNPVFMLDEIDKVGMDFRGDPSAALLEVLDPEQNHSFSDHYLGVPFDLSNVMFIMTANQIDPIPAPLRDRMEIIDISGYTTEEKVGIARNYLIPRQLSEHGVKTGKVAFTDAAIDLMIMQYTREAGVRNLEREIANVLRKIARKLAEGKEKRFKITPSNVNQYLGIPKFLPEAEQENDEVGVATGLAWTPTGGDIIRIEATLMKGKGGLTLTGHLGDVMKESAHAALSYIRSKEKELGIKTDLFAKSDIHIHVPAGAIPKDGPSAGITMATALASLLTGKAVRRDVAMTGEVTLRGRVLPIGGLKEKILAAKRAGMKTVVLPKRNEKDLEEVPRHVQRGLDLVFAEHMDAVLSAAFKIRKTPSVMAKTITKTQRENSESGRESLLRSRRFNSARRPASSPEHHMDLRQLGEFGLIDRIQKRFPPPASTVLGIGDDAAAILPSKKQHLLLTTDTLIEEVHFDPAFSTFQEVGYKSVMVNVSDIAAMGGAPRYILISLGLTGRQTVEAIDQLYKGIERASRETGLDLIGGNIAFSTGPFFISPTVVGEIPKKEMVTRAGAGEGDHLYVTGTLGDAAAGLALLKKGIDTKPFGRLTRRYRAPKARWREGRLWQRPGFRRR